MTKLEGVEMKSGRDTLNLDAWLNGRFQKNREQKVNETIGLRDFYIRLYNQYNYSLFNITESPGVIIGKNNYLYLSSYTNNYSGKNFSGWLKITSNVKRIKMLQEFLKKKNIDLIVAFAPGKASYYPEYIPDYIRLNSQQNNYTAYRCLLLKNKVNFIDMQEWFNNLKNTTGYKLYPKYGVHWNYYGASLAGDTLKSYIEWVHSCSLPQINIDNVTLRDSLKNPDYDVGELLNIFSRERDTMPYPSLSFKQTETVQKPKGLIISDSYAWHLYELQILQQIFSDWSFWFYNNTMYPESFKNKLTTNDINYNELIQRKDVIVLLASEGTYDLFPYGILEKTENLYIPKNKDELIEYYIMKIKADSGWLQNVILKARVKKISIDSALKADATWMYENQISKE